MIVKLLSFLRVLDASRQISITNVTIIAVLTKILAEPKASYPEIVALGCALANYAVKKYFEHKAAPQPTVELGQLAEQVKKLQAELEDNKNKVSSLSLAAGLRPIPPKR